MSMFANKSGVKMEKNVTVCPQCGSQFSENVQFCDKCGFNIEKDKVINEQKRSFSPNTTASHSTPSRSSNALNNKYQGYIQIIAVIEVAAGLFSLFLAVLLGAVAPFIPDFIKSSNANSETPYVYTQGMLDFFTVLVFVVAVIVLIVSVLTIYVGYKLYHLENIGRFGSMIIASFALLMVPFGTAFGIISLVLLSKSETIELIRERNKYL